MNGNKYRIETVYVAGEILRAVANSREPLGAAEIGKLCGINTNMAFRQCATLEELGFLKSAGDRYDLGMGLALFWARKKSRLEGERDRVDRDIKDLMHETVDLGFTTMTHEDVDKHQLSSEETIR